MFSEISWDGDSGEGGGADFFIGLKGGATKKVWEPLLYTGKNCKRSNQTFKMLLIVQFLEVKNNKSMYNLQSKTVNWYSQNSLRDTPHSKVFCLNNHVF